MRPMFIRVIQVLRGGTHPAQVALAVAVGLLAGFATGWNLTFVALLVVAALLPVHGTTFAVAWSAGALLAFVAHGLCRSLGFLLLDELRLQRLVAALGDSVLVALLDWDRYDLVGGLALGVVLAVPAARGGWLLAISRQGGDQSAGEPLRWIRREAWATVPVVLVATMLLPWTWLEQKLAHRALQMISDALGIPLESNAISFSLSSGRLTAQRLTLLSHHDDESAPLVECGRLDARLRSGALVRGRLVVETVTLEGISRPRGAALSERLEARAPIELRDYLHHWSAAQARLGWIPSLIALLERFAVHDDERLAGSCSLLSLLDGTTSTLDERSALGTPHPSIQIDKLRCLAIDESCGLGVQTQLQFERLTTAARRLGEPTLFTAQIPQWSSQATAVLNLHADTVGHAIEWRSATFPLVELLDETRVAPRVTIQRGLMTLAGSGHFTAQRLHLPLTVEAQQLAAQWIGTQPVAGLSTELWNQGLQALGGLRSEAVVTGRWDDLRVQVESSDLVAHFKHQLRSGGNHELVERIDRHLAGIADPSYAPVVGEVPASLLPAEFASLTAPQGPQRVGTQAPGGYPVTDSSPGVDPLPTFQAAEAPSVPIDTGRRDSPIGRMDNPYADTRTAPHSAPSPTSASEPIAEGVPLGSIPTTTPQVESYAPVQTYAPVQPYSPIQQSESIPFVADQRGAHVAPPVSPYPVSSPPPGPINFAVGPDLEGAAQMPARSPTVRRPSPGSSPVGPSQSTATEPKPSKGILSSSSFNSWFSSGKGEASPAPPADSVPPAQPSRPANVTDRTQVPSQASVPWYQKMFK